MCAPAVLKPQCSHLAPVPFAAGPASPQSQVFKIHVADCERPLRIGLQLGYPALPEPFDASAAPVARMGGWEVTVTFDAVRSDVYCSYRRRPAGAGRPDSINTLLPPVAKIQIFTDSASKPKTVTVDPAGLRFPAMFPILRVAPGKLCTAAKRSIAIRLAGSSEAASPAPPHSYSSAIPPATGSLSSTPLRI